ncbi:MAG: hypothetical protein HY329_22255 [Chloroflexi bacterium]|nr:hypothetical protein [Chloroflexota bacterium]
MEERSIYVDLADLELPAVLATADDRAVVAAYLHERFTPFADEGWEAVVHPASAGFDGWTYRDGPDRTRIAGANVQCRRASVVGGRRVVRPLHELSEHRVRQLTERPWTAEPGSKAWRELR